MENSVNRREDKGPGATLENNPAQEAITEMALRIDG
jgi:hypothetical protein